MKTIKSGVAVAVGLVAVWALQSACIAEARCIEGNGTAIRQPRAAGQFTEIELRGSMNLHVSQGPQASVEVEAAPALLPIIETTIDNGKLTIGTKDGTCIRTSRGLRVHVTVPNLRAVSVAGSGDVIGGSSFQGERLSVRVTGSGNVQLRVRVAKLDVSVVGSGDVTVAGTATNQQISVTGSGDVTLHKTTGQRVVAQVQGSGDVAVRATESLNARVQGSGDIIYYGDPKQVTRVSHGSGSIRPGS